MVQPLQILFHNTRPIEDEETRIRQEVAELEKSYSHLVSCRVDVEVPEHHRRGSLSKVRVDLGVPSRRAMAGTESSLLGGTKTKQELQHLLAKAQHKDVSMAVHAAFNIARRRLEDSTGG
jgi:hypothetical protein